MATQARPVLGELLPARLETARALSRAIAAPLSDAEASLQPMDDASPAKWHLAHTTWFFETFVLRDHVPGYSAKDESWAYLFNSYYEGEGSRHPRPRRGMLGRPSLDAILDWRNHVDEALQRALPGLPPAALQLVELGLNHEQQHQELMLTDILATLVENPLAPAAWNVPSPAPGPAPPALGSQHVPGGITIIGHDGASFAFDCETPRHQSLIHPHELSDRPVSNSEWLRFMAEGGYEEPRLWMSDGWDWVSANGIEAPLYWRRDGDSWLRFGLDGLHPIDPAEPVC